MSSHPILNLCARVTGHPEQQLRLRELCEQFTDWEMLLHHSEMEGMTPLLDKHIKDSGSNCPISVRRSLAILVQQHRHYSLVLIQTLQEVLELFEKEKITPIIIKGAALCHTVYPDPALRPMRDIDILIHNDEVHLAQAALESIGFKASKAPIPHNHFHLPALLKKTDGCDICIEIHRGLYPDCPPYYLPVHFEEIFRFARKFAINGQPALTMGDEDMLWYLYQHGFCMPLTYDPYRLINSADIISLTEKYFPSFNWPKIWEKYPPLSKALPLMHHLSPWDPEAIPPDFVPMREKRKRRPTDPFQGWPRVQIRRQKIAGKSCFYLFHNTFIPPRWWLMVYYGISSWRGFIRCIIVRHPRHVFWWVKLHYSYLGSLDKDKGWAKIRSLFSKIC